jgi:tellurite methyltransferase
MTKAQEATRAYHQHLYARARLFEPGTWLEKPDAPLVALVHARLAHAKHVRVLDLGSGVGRNAIPIAHIVGPHSGTVTCIDFLDIAIAKLRENAERARVSGVIDGHVQDFERYAMPDQAFDLVIAYSALEHGVSRPENVVKLLRAIQRATKRGGINYLGMTTNVEEREVARCTIVPSEIAVTLSYAEAKHLLEELYTGWEVIQEERTPYEERYIKHGREIRWRNDFLTFSALKDT